MNDTPPPPPEPTAPAEAAPKPKKKGVGFIKGTLLVLAVALIAVLGLAAVQPDDYSVARSATMTAPKKAAFDQVNDFHNWEAWSPWAKLDPAMKVTYSGPTSGPGAEYAWEGNDAVGAGKMTILETKPGESIKIKLEFLKPFPSDCETVFSFRQERANAFVMWRMTGKHNFLTKVFCVFTSMDAMVGPDFEKGLAAMKEKVEEKK